MKIPLYKKLLSFLHPVWIKDAPNAENPELELLLYRGRWQLATRDAIYSDGEHYTPMLTAYKALAAKLSEIKTALVLGSGLGSAVQIMQKKGYSPAFTLVDHDRVVLQWAKELMPEYAGPLKLLQADAYTYLDTDSNKYDLLIVDVFTGQQVPNFVTTEYFMQNCRAHITEGGSFVLNYIISEGENWAQFRAVLDKVFPGYRVISRGINRVIVATA